MSRRGFLRSSRALFLAPIALPLAAACTTAPSGNDVVQLHPTLLGPKSLLDSITKVRVIVYDSSVSCDENTGLLENTPDEEPIATELSNNCDNARFCGQLQIPRTGDDRVFAAIGRAPGADGEELDVGVACTTARVDGDLLDITLQLHTYVPEATCGNDLLELTEQCEKPDPLCDDRCQTQEIVLSKGSNDPANYTTSNTQDPKKAGDKERPFFLWPESRDDSAGKLVTFFTDRSDTTASADLGGAIRGTDFTATGVLGDFASKFTFFIPTTSADPFPAPRAANDQAYPVATYANGAYYVAFDEAAGPDVDIKLRKLDPNFKPYWTVGVNGATGGGEIGIQTKAVIASNNAGVLFIAWYNQNLRRYQGRRYGDVLDATKRYGELQDIGGAEPDAASIAVTAIGSDFVVTWETSSGIRFRVFGQDGRPLGDADTTVTKVTGTYHHPSVAARDRRFIIVWQNADKNIVAMQRYENENKPVDGDDLLQLNSDGQQPIEPVVTGSPGGGGSYVVGWIDKGNGQVMGRFVGKLAGYLTNNVDGQDTNFQVSVAAGHTRVSPNVVVGGAGFVVFGWEDRSATPGIFGRRFPIANY